MNILQLSKHFAILDEPRKPYAYRNTKLRYKLLKSNRIWKCELCSSKDKLEAHHIKKIKYIKRKDGYTSQDTKGDHSIENGQILCKKCHVKAHYK